MQMVNWRTFNKRCDIKNGFVVVPVSYKHSMGVNVCGLIHKVVVVWRRGAGRLLRIPSPVPWLCHWARLFSA